MAEPLAVLIIDAVKHLGIDSLTDCTPDIIDRELLLAGGGTLLRGT
jgi:actin-like ATPase involved in cell morphogenesis